MARNKKVLNATETEFDGKHFKSLLEKKAWQLYNEAGLKLEYEPDKIVIIPGFKPSISFYKPIKAKGLSVNNAKVRDITYTPDFIIKGKKTYYIEVKGFVTDRYVVKVKLFRKWLESQLNSVFFELHSVRDIKKSIEIINTYEKDT